MCVRGDKGEKLQLRRMRREEMNWSVYLAGKFNRGKLSNVKRNIKDWNVEGSKRREWPSEQRFEHTSA
jgi:hypothetical protein